MVILKAVVICTLVGLSSANLKFPTGFMFGASTAAYQIEGAWNASDKGKSIWDVYTQTSNQTKHGDTGDVACDSYNLWKRDAEMAAELGLHFYRFSISWPRILPSGFTNYVSQDGVNYYNNLINELLKNGVEPVVTLYHYDLPQTLQDYGGWLNPIISDRFADYARVVYKLFGDRVKTWITLNEPIVFCDVVYNGASYAPGIKDPDRAGYLCNKNILLAHAKAYRIYDTEFKPTCGGQVSISNHLFWFEPYSPEDEELTELVREYQIGRYSHPIYSEEGGWPPAIEKIIAERSLKEGYTFPLLPAFTPQEIELIKGTYDFFAINYYTGRLVRKAKEGENIGSWFFEGAPELNAVLEFDPSWPNGSIKKMKIYPEGIQPLMKWLRAKYGDIVFLITETGYPSSGYNLDDIERIKYHRDYLTEVLGSIEDGANIIGYTVWSLIDNFEWSTGFSDRFGLYEVNYTDPHKTRTPRKSAHFYSNVIKTLSLDVPEECNLDN